MAQAVSSLDHEPEAFNLRAILYAFYRGWIFIAICAVIAVYIGVDYLHSATYLYSAQMQVTPVQTDADQGTSSRLGALSSIANLASALPTTQTGTQFRLYVDSIYSRDLAEEMAKDTELMHAVFAGEWNTATQSWEAPPVPMSAKIRIRLRSMLGFPTPATWQPPDGARLKGYIGDNVTVVQDARKPYLVQFVFTHPDPAFGVHFLDVLNATTDQHLRRKSLQRTRAYIDYLNKQLATVTVAEHRLAITDSLSQQEKFAMVASSGTPFAADVFERPWAADTPISPSARQILVQALLVGLSVGGAIAYLLSRYMWAGFMFRWFRRKTSPAE